MIKWVLSLIIMLPSIAFPATSITQYGITWTFDGNYTTGQYVNGDYWVVGPVTINSITRPASNSDRDGSMINPVPGLNQGYDSRWGTYTEADNIANDLPLVVNAGSSIISTISRDPTNTVDRVRPILTDAAILTVVSSEPSATAFRPNYSGSTKNNHTYSNIQTQYLATLTPTASSPSIATVAAYFARPWVDHYLGWQGDDFHPENNMPNYGGAMALQTSTGGLALMLDYTVAQKEELLINFIQLGIDLFAIVENGGYWGDPGGTIGVGRKLPILLAGLLLNDTDMINVASDYDTREIFQEDHQTFLLTEAAQLATYNAENCAAGEDYCHEGYYDAISLGTPVWGERAYRWENNPTGYPYLPGKIGYKTSTFCSTMGAALVVRFLNISTHWNYSIFLDWIDEDSADFSSGACIYGSDFVWEMWDTYRAGSPYVHLGTSIYEGSTGSMGITTAGAGTTSISEE